MPNGEVATILVNANQPLPRQNFTIAHELAHWALRSPRLASATVDEAKDAFRSEEMLANAVAGRLLLPSRWLKAEFAAAANPQSHNLHMLQKIARTAEVSLGTAIVRLREELLWRKTVLHWVHEDGAWTFDGEAGIWPWQEGQTVPTTATRFSLQAAAAGGPGLRHWVLPLECAGSEVEIEAEICIRRKSVLALLTLPEMPYRYEVQALAQL